MLIRIVRTNYELTVLASGEAIACLAVAEPARRLAGFQWLVSAGCCQTTAVRVPGRTVGNVEGTRVARRVAG